MAASSTSASPPWIELPDDLTANILQRLNTEEVLMSAQLVCSTWWRVCKNPAVWHVIDLDCRDWPDKEFDNMCRFTVDHSQGQLVDLTLISFDEDYGFLNDVANRSSQLRCLTLVMCEKMETALTDALKKLPQLEELRLIGMPLLSVEQIESIGISCPVLKSFTYEDENYLADGRFRTKHAIAIGKTMTNLRHLRLWRQRMTNKGLEAILDGCPHLESLDLWRCRGLKLEGALSKRCSDGIKHLRLPSDSSDIYWLNVAYFREDWLP